MALDHILWKSKDKVAEKGGNVFIKLKLLSVIISHVAQHNQANFSPVYLVYLKLNNRVTEEKLSRWTHNDNNY